MDFSNEFRVGLPLEAAWALLTDVERIAPCMPGAQLTGVKGDEYAGTVKIKVGPVTAQYKGVASFEQKDTERHVAVLRAQGRDTRGQGNANALITARLVADGDGTSVTVDTELSITGKVAQFGKGVIGDVSKKLLLQFAECLEGKLVAEIVSEPHDAAAPVASAEGSASIPPAAESADPTGRPPEEPRAAEPAESPGPPPEAPIAPQPARPPEPAGGTAEASTSGEPAEPAEPAGGTTETPTPDPTTPDPTGTHPTGTHPTGTDPPRAEPVGAEPVGAEPPGAREPSAGVDYSGNGQAGWRTVQSPEAEPLDLMDAAGGAMIRRAAPAAAAMLLLALIVWWVRHHRA